MPGSTASLTLLCSVPLAILKWPKLQPVATCPFNENMEAFREREKRTEIAPLPHFMTGRLIFRSHLCKSAERGY